MIIELQIVDETLSNKEIRPLIDKINNRPISKVSVLPCHIPVFKKYLSKSIKLSTIIDFPFGILSTESRKSLIQNAIKNGAQSIEVLCPSYMIVNKLYTQLKNDISEIYDLCTESKVDISYILEYRAYTYDSLYKICKMLLLNKINSIYISTGYKLDDMYDHLIAMTMIQKKIPDMNIVPNANIFNANHQNVIKMANLSKIRVSSLYAAELFLN
tara:strand:+ start:581 stop:1222 length:642 start_codon:yes stop_codon:yes gene_type:complete